MAQRQLVLIAKVLQNLANLANTKKEAFMESMLDFIERNKPKMIHYYKSLLVSIIGNLLLGYINCSNSPLESRSQGESTNGDESVCACNCPREFFGLLAHSYLS